MKTTNYQHTANYDDADDKKVWLYYEYKNDDKWLITQLLEDYTCDDAYKIMHSVRPIHVFDNPNTTQFNRANNRISAKNIPWWAFSKLQQREVLK